MIFPRSLNIYLQQIKQYGLYNCLYRLLYILIKKTGILKKRFPTWQWGQRPLAYWVGDRCPTEPTAYKKWREKQRVKFFFPLGRPPTADFEWKRKAIEEADMILSGRFRFFSHRVAELGFPFKWLYNPFTGYREEASQHWCEIDSLDESRGDIKYLWEPARFGWSYTLVRAYNATGDEKYAEAFWVLWESFCQANPIQMGANWMCGQEVSIRALACIFALHAFWDCESANAERIAQMGVFLAASCERIEGNIGYARSTRSNHGIGEAIALYTVGVLFSEFKQAASWKKLGKRILEEDARNLIFSDGSYIQHSMNYLRFMLQVYLWALVLAEKNGERFSNLILARVKKAYRFLYQHQDPLTGRVPNYGSNDGALIFPLNDCDYLDYRGVLGAIHYYFERKPLYEKGCWQEDIQWLWGDDSLYKKGVSELVKESSDFNDGGYYILRGNNSWGMVRCHTYRTRPGQSDMLHFDLWWKGINILRDSGSYSYFPHDNWNKYFLSTKAHNTVVVGDSDQMEKGPRFMWLYPVKSRFIKHDITDSFEIWQGEHYGYKRLNCKAVCRRTIYKIDSDNWVIVDDILGSGKEHMELLWHLADFDYSHRDKSLELYTPQGNVFFDFYSSSELSFEIVRGRKNKPIMGWESLTYGHKKPSLSLSLSAKGDLPIRFVSLVSMGKSMEVGCESNMLNIGFAGRGVVKININDLSESAPIFIEKFGKSLKV